MKKGSKKEAKYINVFEIKTKDKSIWSNLPVHFYFLNEEQADAFVKELNSIIGIDIEFEKVGYVTKKYSSPLKIEYERSTEDAVNYFYDWALDFTQEHKS